MTISQKYRHSVVAKIQCSPKSICQGYHLIGPTLFGLHCIKLESRITVFLIFSFIASFFMHFSLCSGKIFIVEIRFFTLTNDVTDDFLLLLRVSTGVRNFTKMIKHLMIKIQLVFWGDLEGAGTLYSPPALKLDSKTPHH